MASRKAQKDAARERRLAEERARAEKARRARRLQMLGGVVALAVVLVVVAIVVSSGGSSSSAPATKPASPQARQAAATVGGVLTGIPQQGNTLGSPTAKVTMTEYGDLVCPVCRSFALGPEQQLIANEVRQGKVKIVYKALETASQTANDQMFVPGQTAALAAGQQKLGWNYILLFYHEQGDETQSYVTDDFLDGLARQIPGLDYSRWSADRNSSSLVTQVRSDLQAAENASFDQTPTIVLSGPKSQAQPIVGLTSYAVLQSKIRSVS